MIHGGGQKTAADLSPNAHGDSTVPLQVQNVKKSFGATVALEGVSIGFAEGKVHALVGENGAGKSTLFKICAGFLKPDSGIMTLNGQAYAPATMHQAQQMGVALVFQEMTINPSIDIAENIFIDRLHDYAGFLGITRWQKLRHAAQQLLDEIGAHISVDQSITELDLGQLKVLEVARALSYNPRVLLLDESTAFLNTQEIDTLFRVVNRLREQGIAIGYISHHLDEIDRIADSITILKDGNRVGDFERGELTGEQIEARMVGREIGKEIYPPERNFDGADPILTLNNLTLSSKLQNIDLTLHRGEILGVGGLKGSGGEALVETIIGAEKPSDGTMLFNGQPFKPQTPADAWERGIAYLPGDRTGEGLIVDFTVQMNLSMAAIPHRGPFIDQAAERQMVEEMMPRLKIKAESPTVPANSLSGGNLQKVVLGKCMAPKPVVLLLNNPTRGIDVGARMQIYATIRQLADRGLSIVLLSEDLLELIGMSDRIVVMRKGRISNIFAQNDTMTEKTIISQMI